MALFVSWLHSQLWGLSSQCLFAFLLAFFLPFFFWSIYSEWLQSPGWLADWPTWPWVTSGRIVLKGAGCFIFQVAPGISLQPCYQAWFPTWNDIGSFASTDLIHFFFNMVGSTCRNVILISSNVQKITSPSPNPHPLTPNSCLSLSGSIFKGGLVMMWG